MIVGAVVVLVLVGVVLSYNRFVEQRQLVHDSWANVETELQRRYDLIPNLVSAVQGYADHEREVFAEVTEARARALANHGPPEQQARDENGLIGALKHLLAVAEGYPQLKASRHFADLQGELTNTEDRIQAARRFYNANVRDLNRRVESVPSNVIAWAFGFERAQYFQIDEAVRVAGAPAVRN